MILEIYDMDNTQTLKRWRLILGAESQEQLNSLGCGMMTEEDILMDSAGLVPKISNGPAAAAAVPEANSADVVHHHLT